MWADMSSEETMRQQNLNREIVATPTDSARIYHIYKELQYNIRFKLIIQNLLRRYMSSQLIVYIHSRDPDDAFTSALRCG